MTAPKNPIMLCPHCQGRAEIRSSSGVSEMVREVRYQCRDDVGCGFAWVAQLSVVHAVRPSLRPNPAVCIPLSASYRPLPAAAIGSDLANLAAAASRALATVAMEQEPPQALAG